MDHTPVHATCTSWAVHGSAEGPTRGAQGAVRACRHTDRCRPWPDDQVLGCVRRGQAHCNPGRHWYGGGKGAAASSVHARACLRACLRACI